MDNHAKDILTAVDRLDSRGQTRFLGYLQGLQLRLGSEESVVVTSQDQATGIGDAFGFSAWFIQACADGDGAVTGDLLRACLLDPEQRTRAQMPLEPK